MKKTNKLLYLFSLLLLLSCTEEPIENPSEEHSLSIVGIKEAFDYTFHPASKSITTPDEVNTLTIRIIDDMYNVVYEQWYHDWSEDSSTSIPDSIFIPSIGTGQYKIYASTTDNYYYHYDDYYYYEDLIAVDGDSIPDDYDPNFDMVIDSWVVSTNPIYVGNQDFEIGDEDLTVELEMKNISAKLTLQYEGYAPDMYINASLIGPNAQSYSFQQDDFFEWDEGYEYWTDLWMYEYDNVENYYFLPRTLDRVRLYMHDYRYDFSVEQQFSFEEQISMGVGDALTININIDNIIEGSGTGTLAWENIEWNNLGEINFD